MKRKIPVFADPRIVILGGGFGGLNHAKGLRDKPFQVVLFDKHNYHTFQPLLYQVATGRLEPDSIATDFRNRLVVFANWAWNYLSYDKGIQLIIRPFQKAPKEQAPPKEEVPV